MTAKETERLLIMEEKQDLMAKQQVKMEKQIAETHDAVLRLPEELQKKFVTRIEFAAVKWFVALLIAGLTIISWGR